jgi:cytoskeletal protein RodZ
MSTLGERLRQERESRNITLQEISESTKIALRYLEALEGDDFASLPGGVFIKGYVAAYAQHIGVELDPLIEAYALVQQPREPEATADDLGGFPAHGASVATTSVGNGSTQTHLRPRRRIWLLVPFALLLAAIAGWAYFRGGLPGATRSTEISTAVSEREPSEDRDAARPPEAALPVRASRVFGSPTQPEPTTDAERSEVPEEEQPRVEELRAEAPLRVEEKLAIEEEPPLVQELVAEVRTADAGTFTTVVEGEGRLSITEFGVGKRVVHRQLEQPGVRFKEGTRVSFWTRVVGGRAGERVRHVWLRQERELDSIELSLGGPHWRTHSRKTLYPGSAGQWVVEARDAAGRVLARQEFTCVKTESVSRATEHHR